MQVAFQLSIGKEAKNSNVFLAEKEKRRGGERAEGKFMCVILLNGFERNDAIISMVIA